MKDEINFEQRKKFLLIIKSDKKLMKCLEIVRELDLPDWFIAAGAIRNLVWDYLHKYEKRTPLNDVDVVYFNSTDISPEADLKIWEKLCKIEGNVNWNVFNQARSHIKNKYQREVFSSIESISYWSETPTCVGVRLEKSEDFSICAPWGLGDLINLEVKPIPKPFQDLELYNKRIKEKNWKKIWPKLKIYVH